MGWRCRRISRRRSGAPPRIWPTSPPPAACRCSAAPGWRRQQGGGGLRPGHRGRPRGRAGDARAARRAPARRRRPRRGVRRRPRARPGLTWVLDPIDGTRAFLSGATTWGTLIGLDAGDGPLLGLDRPALYRRALHGRPRPRRDGPRRRRAGRWRCAPAPGSPTRCSTPPFPEIGTPAERAGFEAVRDRVRLTRYGFDCYAYALVALGQVDLVIEAGLQALRHPGAAGGDRGGRRRRHRLARRPGAPRRPGARRGRRPRPRRGAGACSPRSGLTAVRRRQPVAARSAAAAEPRRRAPRRGSRRSAARPRRGSPAAP